MNPFRDLAGRLTPRSRQLLLASLVFAGLAVAYYGIYIFPFLPNQYGRIGHDYAGVLSDIMTGLVHLQKAGGFPWFTPAACAGNMFVAGIANPLLNIPQALSFTMEPVAAIRVTFIGFAAAGGCGMYLLLRRGFSLSRSAALIGATLMLFNGFYAYRMIIGHIGFHGFMLAPLITYLMMNWKGPAAACQGAILAAFMIAYIILSSGAYTLMPVGLASVAILLIADLRNGTLRIDRYALLATALVVAIALCLFKLSLSFGAAMNFQRDDYLLPGIPGAVQAILLPVRLLFFSTPDWISETRYIFTNYEWNIDRHELEMGVGWVALLLITLGAVRSRLRFFPRASWRGWLALTALAVILSVPVMLNYYSPAWNGLIKSTPVLKSFSLLVRLYASYIPIVVVLASLGFALLPSQRRVWAVLAIGAILVTCLLEDRDYYKDQGYDPGLLLSYYPTVMEEPEKIPPVDRLMFADKAAFNGGLFLLRNETFVWGASNIHCRNDAFGYELEYFPRWRELMPETSVFAEKDGHFNMKNPVCYVFPEENQCVPGDHFTLAQRAELERFVSYQQIDFNVPRYQSVANITSLVTLICSVLALLLIRLRFHNRTSTGDSAQWMTD